MSVRDQVIPDFKDKIDEMAYKLADEVNKAHNQGFDRHSREGGDFFSVPMDVKDAAKDIRFNDADCGRRQSNRSRR